MIHVYTLAVGPLSSHRRRLYNKLCIVGFGGGGGGQCVLLYGRQYICTGVWVYPFVIVLVSTLPDIHISEAHYMSH